MLLCCCFTFFFVGFFWSLPFSHLLINVCSFCLVGLAARIVQHELDHLDGILFPQCVPDQTFLVPQASIDGRGGWAADWPSRGSYKTSLGDLSNEK